MNQPEVVIYFKKSADCTSAIKTLQELAAEQGHTLQVKEEHDGRTSKYAITFAEPKCYKYLFGLEMSWDGAQWKAQKNVVLDGCSDVLDVRVERIEKVVSA